MDWDELGEAIDEIAAMPSRRARLATYEQLLGTLAPGEEGHAEVLSCMADDLVDEGRLDDAESAYQRALDDGGRTVLQPRAGLLAVALARGDDARVDELLAELISLSRTEQLVIGDYEWIAESLEDAGRLRAALRWFTIPLRDIQPGDLDLMPPLCLDGRWRVRRALDLPVDAYDEAHDVWHEVNAAQT
jgi:tetratricopeptide (TPR) repeat protein